MKALWRTLVATLVGALAAGLVFSGYEALAVKHIAGLVPAWSATGSAAAIAALLTSAPVIALAVLLHRARATTWLRRYRANPEHSAAAITSALIAVALLSSATLGLALGIEQATQATAVRAVAAALSLPLAAVVVEGVRVMAAAGLERALQRSPRWLASLPSVSVVVLGTTAVCLVLLADMGRQVIEDLDVKRFVLFGVTTVGAVVGASLASRRLAIAALAVPAACVAALALLYLVRDTPMRLALELRQKTNGARFVLQQFDDDYEPRLGASFEDAPPVSCWANHPPPTVPKARDAPAGSPDIVLITIDALRWDHTAFGGYRRDTTPELARWAASGAVLEASSVSSCTRQTFRGVFTGIYPSLVRPPKTGKWSLSIPPRQPTLARFLAAAGYETVAFVSSDSIFPVQDGALQGFSSVDARTSGRIVRSGLAARQVVSEILRVLREDDHRPRFIWAHLFEPHQPYRTGPTPVHYGSRDLDRYDAAIHYVDREVGRLLASGLGSKRPRPLVVLLTADHGQAFGEHGNQTHGSSVYDEEIRVPLLVWGPGVVARRHRARVSLIDVFPTVLDFARVESPKAICGKSLGPLLRAERDLQPSPVYTEQIPDDRWAFFALAFIVGRQKLVVHPRLRAVELFDLDKDPAERHDIAGQHPADVRALTRALVDFHRARGMDPRAYGLD